MKKRFLLNFLLFASPLTLFGQSPSGSAAAALPTQNVMPRSPQAAAFEKFVDLPVSLHTGIPKINIPVHEIRLKDLTIPIELNYHASGIKINETAGNVGLGWSLSAGGMINISTHGLSDFEQNGWINPFVKVPADATIRTKFAFNEEGKSYETNPDYILDINTVNGLNDTEPDVFSYSFPGKNGKFFFDQNGGYHMMPFDDIQVSYAQMSSSPYPDSFTIKDNKGNLFIFGGREIMYTTGATTCSGDNVSTPFFTWFGKSLATCYYLTQIKTVKNEVVTFTYETEFYTINNTPTDFRYARINLTDECQMSNDLCRISSKTDAAVPRITTISTNTGERVEFKYSQNDRLDLKKSKALESIEIYTGAGIKKVNLTYDYYRSGPVGSTDQFDYRLKLTEVAEAGKPGYKLDYDSSIPLPRRFSNGQDHWGYNNGKNGMVANGNMLPASPTSWEFNIGISREPDSVQVKAGMISKLTYPAGGYTLFDFEANKVYNEEVRPVITTGGTTVSANINEEVKSESFTLPSGVTRVRVKWDTGTTRGQLGYSTINIQGPNGFNKILTGRSAEYTDLTGLIIGQTYTINVTRPSVDITFMGVVSLNWEIAVNTLIKENLLTGGVRIKSISHYDGSNKVLSRRYGYDVPGTVNHSSADVFFKPLYEYKTYKGRAIHINDGFHCSVIMQVSNSLADLNSVEGGNLVYTNVDVFEGDKLNGYTAHEFLSDQSSQRFIAFPFPAKVVNQWMNGLPLKTTQYQYNTENNKYFPVHIVQNFFKSAPGTGLNDYSVRGVKIGILRPEWIQATPIGIGQVTEFSIENFKLFSTRCHLDSVKETFFDKSGFNPVVALKKFQYTNPAHMEMTKAERINSDGELITETYQYVPENAVSTGGVYTEMNDLHMSGYLIEKTVFSNNTLKTRERTNYSKFNTNNYEPSFTERSTGNSGSDIIWRYHKYDTLGNVLSQSQNHGAEVNYLWSYNGRYPVAEIKNVTYANIESVLGSAEIERFKNLENPDKAAIDLFVNQLIDSLPNAHITKFSYKPGIGIDTGTDEKGMVTYYEYDEFRRLKTIKDQQQNIIKSFNYNYKP